ncbi:hypothetical protein EGM51_07305 [Verrucomicrobia bacterium S94]|nr:hypothetical protein EGM51_07305 [Verrucomicrobia bacterium S94]
MKSYTCDSGRVFRAGIAGAMLLCCVAEVQALETVPLLPEGPSKTLLQKKKPIYAETSGSVPVNFKAALQVLLDPAFMTNVQEAYNTMIDDDGKPEFSIQQTSSNTYFYVNRKNERTDITEVLRKQNSETEIDIVLYSAGRRSFGKFQSVIHIRVEQESESVTRYTAAVYAYPENAVSRFLVRHLGLVERYFRKKTRNLTAMITTITSGLCEEAVAEEKAGESEGITS